QAPCTHRGAENRGECAGGRTGGKPVSRAPEAVHCPLCLHDGGTVLHRTPEWRVILPDEPLWPGFTRVVWNAHVAEMSQLDTADQQELLSVVMRVERAQR